MSTKTVETRARTNGDGTLNLSLPVGLQNMDVQVVVHIRSLNSGSEVDINGWPKGYFETVPGSMPELSRAPQGNFETRSSFE